MAFSCKVCAGCGSYKIRSESYIYPLLTGHALLCHVAAALHCLAHEHMVAIVVRTLLHIASNMHNDDCYCWLQYTNNTVSSSDGGLKPALGQTWSHFPHSRIMLSYTHLHERIATLNKSTRQVIIYIDVLESCGCLFTLVFTACRHIYIILHL